jgi:predicted metal-dependent hydrolase
MNATKPSTTLPFPRRTPALAFDPERVPKRWFADDEYVTAHLIALSLSFPLGEQFFIDSVRAVRGFHPNERGTRALVSEWRGRLFGEGGPLQEVREVWPVEGS